MKLIKLLLVLTLLLSPLNVFAKGKVYKIIDFTKPSDPVAAKVLYNFVIDERKDNPDLCRERVKAGEKIYRAYQIDLNNDGIKEIVGLDLYALRVKDVEGALSILIKHNKIYENISHVIIPYNSKIYVLNTKTNGYRDLLLNYNENDENKTMEIKNLKYGYEYIFK